MKRRNDAAQRWFVLGTAALDNKEQFALVCILNFYLVFGVKHIVSKGKHRQSRRNQQTPSVGKGNTKKYLPRWVSLFGCRITEILSAERGGTVQARLPRLGILSLCGTDQKACQLYTDLHDLQQTNSDSRAGN